MRQFIHTAAALVLASSLVACVSDDLFGDEENAEVLDVASTEQAIGSCTYTLTGAAITKQITSISEPTQLLLELVTVTNKPYRNQLTNMTFPAGLKLVSLATTSCSDTGTGWKCRHQGTVEQTTATSGTGAYSMYFTPLADAGSGCGNGSTQKIDMSITTENWGYYEVAANGVEAIVYPAWHYEGTPLGFEEGAWSFTGNFAAVNDAISSIRVTPGYTVTLYEHANFTGRTKTLTADSDFLSDFNDLASAMWIRRN